MNLFRPAKFFIAVASLMLSGIAGAEEADQNAIGNRQSIEFQDVSISDLESRLGISLRRSYQEALKRDPYMSPVGIKLANVDLNGDGKDDVILLIESRYHCGQLGCTLLIYHYPFTGADPFSADETGALLDYQAMDVFLDDSDVRNAPRIVTYNGSVDGVRIFTFYADANAYR